MTQEELLRSCERSDRMLRAVLGGTPYRTALRFGPALALLLIAAGIASLCGATPAHRDRPRTMSFTTTALLCASSRAP